MQLHRLRLVNFRQHADTDLEFGSGITTIIGPNGAGKSTLLEALAWALYGNTAARGSRDSIRRYNAPARAPVKVEAEFAIGPHEYKVVRSLYTAELFQDGAAQPVANSHQTVSDAVGRALGMNYSEFFNTFFTGQKELTVMASMGPSDRAKFLSRLLGYERLRDAQRHIRGRRTSIRAELQGLEQGFEDEKRLKEEQKDVKSRLRAVQGDVKKLGKDVEVANKALGKLGPKWKEMKQLRDRVLNLDGEKKVAEQVVSEAKREFERLDRELAEAISAQDRLKKMKAEVDRANRVKTDLDHLDKEAQAAGKRRILSGQLGEVTLHVKQVEERLAGMKDVEKEYATAQKSLDEARKSLDELRSSEENTRTGWVRDKQDAETKRLALLDQYRDLEAHRERIVGAGPDGACPTCARPLGEEYESVLGTLSNQLDEVRANGKYYKARMEQLSREPKELKDVETTRQRAGKELEKKLQFVAEAETKVKRSGEEQEKLAGLRKRVDELQQELQGLADSYDQDRHDALRLEMDNLSPVLKTAEELERIARHAERLVKDATRSEKHLSEKEEKLKGLITTLEDAGFSEESFEKSRTEFEAAEEALRVLQLKAAEIAGDEKALVAELNSVERRLDEWKKREERASEVRVDLNLHNELDEAFEDLRNDLNSKLRPDLSELGSGFVAELTDGRYQEFELDENYRISVLDEGVPKQVISGGEEDVVNLALRLAISQMVAERAGQPLSLLVLDEIFGSLDEHRRQGVVDLLRRIGDRFPQVILITHVESVREGADRVIRVLVDQKAKAAFVRDDSLTAVTEGLLDVAS